jgi:hypothetical protein
MNPARRLKARVGTELPSVRAIALALVVGVAGAGCSSLPEQPMPYEVIARLKPGVTTMAVAEAALGAPGETEALPDGGEAWLYSFAPDPVPEPPGLPTPTDAQRRCEVLRLVFGPTGVLLTHEFTRSMVGVRESAQASNAQHEALRDIPLE